MAVDTVLARALVTLLQAEQPFSKAATVAYEHDDYGELDGTTTVRVSPESLEHTRQARADWTTDTTIRVSIEGRQQLNTTTEQPTTQADIDDWLTFVDEIAEHAKTLKPGSRKSSSVTFDTRFDRDMIRGGNLFLSTFTILYKFT